jgi:2-polyprenyl-3-methyl-5-hydroxy-6-metoxy-1,4-benzoquinol methylase
LLEADMAHSYATITLESVVRHAVRSMDREALSRHVAELARRLRRDEARMAAKLGRPLSGLDLLEIGPGQHGERARYFARANSVTAIDLDVLPRPWHPWDYLRMARQNGAGRVVKTLGRKILGVDRARRRAWRAEQVDAPCSPPTIVWGNVCAEPLPGVFDVVCSWAVFEHLPDPGRALEHIVSALRPGGVAYLGVHLWTSWSGHHDTRAFTGAGNAVPLWGHLRPETQHLVHPSAYVNKLRLGEWRDLFASKMPGAENLLDGDSSAAMTPEVRRALASYSDEELYAIDGYWLWRKPAER